MAAWQRVQGSHGPSLLVGDTARLRMHGDHEIEHVTPEGRGEIPRVRVVLDQRVPVALLGQGRWWCGTQCVDTWVHGWVVSGVRARVRVCA